MIRYSKKTQAGVLIACAMTILISILVAMPAMGADGPEAAGWYAGDMHVHRSCGGGPEDVSSIHTKMSTNSISFLSLLADMGNGEVQDPITDLPLVNGLDDPVSTPTATVHWDAEWHWDPTYTQYAPNLAIGGHIVSLGTSSAETVWDEYTKPVFDWAHAHNAVAGFAHMQYLDDSIPQDLTCCTPLEYPVEVALGSADFISEDVVDINTPPSATPDSAIHAYYRLLNTGSRPGFAAGTDYPCNGGADPGSVLTYVNIGGAQPTYRNWINGIAQGRTVISRNGHNEFLDLKVNGTATPGDQIDLASAGSVPVTVVWRATQDLSGTIELVKNGVVVASTQAVVASGVSSTLSATVNFTHSGWLAARRMDSEKGHMVHTGAVFVIVNGAPIRASVDDANFFVQWIDNLLAKTNPGGDWNSYFPTQLAAAQARYQAAKALYQQVAVEAAAVPSTLSIDTTSLPGGVLNASYSTSLAASGGTAPYTWSVTGGALPTGLSLDTASGAISGTPTASGAFSVTVTATDAGASAQTASRTLNLTVAADPVCTTNCTIWPDSAVPGQSDAGPDVPVELGVKFRSDSDGYITGIRFFKADTNTGTHVANLWSESGTLMASAVFQNETGSGWQQVDFYTPVAITANTVYIASYHTAVGHYCNDSDYFTAAGTDSPPLHALLNGVSGGNGVYSYGPLNFFPNLSFNSTNYWVDVVFNAVPPVPPTFTSIVVTPSSRTISLGTTQQFTATGNYANGSQDITGLATWSSSDTGVATVDGAGLATSAGVGVTSISAALGGSTGNAVLNVEIPPLAIVTRSLPGGTLNIPYSAPTLSASGGTPPYTWSLMSGSLPPGLSINGSGNITGTPTAIGVGTYNFVVQVKDSGGPQLSETRSLSITVGSTVLIITSAANPFSSYYAEILRAEGLNTFATTDIANVTGTLLNDYDLVILGEMQLTDPQVNMFTSWVNAGGNLIAMRPDQKLAGLLGLDLISTPSPTIGNAYLLANTASGPGVGIVSETMQYHGTADLYDLAPGTASLATLYSDANTPTPNPAVTLRNYGLGQAAAFTFDLARSVVYTRQGNPAWSGQHRDGYPQIRSDDLFFGDASGDAQPDWIDFNKVAIPQADEEQRLFANLILQMDFNKKPLPRFWYLPRDLKAAVVMAGDDHGIGNSGTIGRFTEQMDVFSTPGCSVDNWECIRSTSYIYPQNALTDVQAADFTAQGFEIGAHISSDCADWTPSTLENFFSTQLGDWAAKYSSIPVPTTNRLHCIVWNDYATMPAVELAHGIRFDANYYYWPPEWVNDRPGFFTGSGMPMRFADASGNLIDVYQATTQMTDESGQTYPYTIDTLLARATGTEGYYGVFTVNAHTDTAETFISEVTVTTAQVYGVPVVSARQMLTWLDGRNASTFNSLAWNGSTLSFSINIGDGANGLRAMAPIPSGQTVVSMTVNGNPRSFDLVTIKGMRYARFSAETGVYGVNYAPLDTSIDSKPPAQTNQTSASFSFSSGIAGATFQCKLDSENDFSACSSPKVYSGLAAGNHTFSVRAVDTGGYPDPTPATYSWTIDTTAPTASISYAPAGPYRSGTPITITANFNEAMADAPVPQIAISGANTRSATNMTKVSPTQYTYSYTVSAGTGTATVALSTGTDVAGNPITAAPTSGATFQVDNTAPTAAISYAPAGPYRSGTPITITATFNEAMADAPTPQLTITGANSLPVSNMSKVSPTQYTYSYTVSAGTGTATVALSTGTDLAGNLLTGTPTSGATFQVDNTAPTAAISYAPAGPYKAGTPITITATFNEAMALAPVPQIAITGANTQPATNMNRVSATQYTYSYTVSAGTGTATVALSTGTDLAGNLLTGTPTSGATFQVDNTAPTAAITYSVPGPYKSGAQVTITANFNEAMAVAPVPQIAISGANTVPAANMTRVSATQYTYSYTVSAGTGTATVALSTGTDVAGNLITATPTSGATFQVDNIAPTAAITYSVPGPYRSGTQVTITADFNEAMIDAPAPKIAITGANSLPATNMTKVSPTQYTYSYTVSAGTGTATVALSAGTDLAGNVITGVPTSGATFQVDNTAPTAAISYAPAGPYKAGTPITVTANFSEAMAVVPVPQIAISGANTVSAANMTRVSATQYTYGYTVASGNGTATIALSAGTDLAGNVITGAPTSGGSFTVDNTAPTVTISTTAPNPTNAPIPVTVHFSEAVSGFVSGGVDVTNGSAGPVAGSGADYSFTVTPSNNGIVTISIHASTAQDAAGNGNTASNQISLEFDSVQPTVTISSTAPDPTNTAPIPVAVRFSKSVADFDSSDVTLTNGTMTGGSFTAISGTDYSFSVTPTLNGTVTVGIAANRAHDSANNGNLAAVPLTRTYDTVAPTAAVTYAPAGPYKSGTPITITATFNEALLDAPVPKIAISGANMLPAADMTKVSTTKYTYAFTVASGDGAANVTLSAGTDAAGNVITGTPTSGGSFTIDNTAPSAAISYSAPGPYKAGTQVTITATFSEALLDAPAPQIAISGSNTLTAANMTKVNATHYTYNYTVGLGDGTATIAMSTGTDAAGNVITSAPTSGGTFTVDNTAPTAAMTYAPAGPYKAGALVTITATFSETMLDAPVPKIAISGANTLAAANMTKVSTTQYTYAYTVGSGDGAANITLSAGTDVVGNVVTGAPTSGGSFVVDNTAPTVTIGPPSVTVANSSVSVNYLVTYTGAGAVTLAANDVTLDTSHGSNGTVTVSGTGAASRTITISNITGYGTLGIASISANTASDAAGNMAAGAGPSATFVVDNASGDLNGDGIVDVTDALKTLRITAGLDAATGAEMAHGDVAPIVNGSRQPDGKIDLGDVVVILRRAVGLTDW